MFPGKLIDMIAARYNGGDLDIDAIDALVGIHVQLSDKAAADQANAYFRHRNAPRMRAQELLEGPGSLEPSREGGCKVDGRFEPFRRSASGVLNLGYR